DGIRDRNVTGVQTCALPILRRCTRPLLALPLCLLLTSCDSASSSTTANNTTTQGAQTTNSVALADLQDVDVQNNLTDDAVDEARSEERRVGKEERGRWTGEQ